MRHTLDPTQDIVFKMLLADPRNRDLLIDLLTTVLRPKVPIRMVIVLNPEIPKEAVTDKGIVLDLLVLLEDGRQVNVEMQAYRQAGWRLRSMYYWARTYGGQLTPGLQYSTLKPVVVIAFLGYREIKGTWVHSVFEVRNRRTHQRFSRALEMHIIELPKLKKMKDIEQQENPALARWARFFGATSDLELETLATEDTMMDRAYTRLRELSADEKAQAVARDRERAMATYRIDMGAAIEMGEKRGKKRGEKRGEKRGAQTALAAAVLRVLQARAIPVDDTVRTQILACRDLPLLDRWVALAVSVTRAEELLAPPAAL